MSHPAKACFAFAGLALLASLLAACVADPPEGVFSCALDSDCPRGQACAPDQLCRAAPDDPTRAGADGSISEPSVAKEGGAEPDAGEEQRDEAGTEPVARVDAALVAEAGKQEPNTPSETSDASNATHDAGDGARDAGALDASDARVEPAPDTGPRLEAGPQGAPLGASCQARSDCASAGCVDGVCCDVASCGTCQRCGASGRCEAIASGADSDSCSGGQCNAGRCGLPNGANCSAAGMPCHSGNCIDGVCCNTRCDQACRSCAVTDNLGTCTAISGADDPGSCEGTRSCASAQCATIDAQSLEIGAGNYFGTMSSGWLRLAQVLTVPMAGQLAAIQLDILCWSPVDRFSVGLFRVNSDGTPSTTRLATLVQDATPKDPRTAPPMAMTSRLVTFTPSATLRVSAGDQIAVVAEAPNNTNNCLFQGSRFDAFSGGTGYAQYASDLTWFKMVEDFTFRLLVIH